MPIWRMPAGCWASSRASASTWVSASSLTGTRRFMDVSPEHLVEQANERFQLQDYYGAIPLLEEVIATGRAFADAHHLLGVSYSLAGQPDKALEQLDRALALNPNYVEALIHRALVLNELGREEEANAVLRRARQVGGNGGRAFTDTWPQSSRISTRPSERRTSRRAGSTRPSPSTKRRSRSVPRSTISATSSAVSCSRPAARSTRTSSFNGSCASGLLFSTPPPCGECRATSPVTAWPRARFGRRCGPGGRRIRASKHTWHCCPGLTYHRHQRPPETASRPAQRRPERRKRSETRRAHFGGRSVRLYAFRRQS